MRWMALLLLAALSAVVQAQDAGRDPTALPITLRNAIAEAASASASAPASGAEPARDGIRHVVFANGRGYVVQRGRRYAVGEQLDGARIERVTEQAVWLREAGQVRREPLYSGVEKRPPAAPASPKPAARNSKEKQP
ncbi:hypothetical protein [Roseateles sp.]|uniref:hypothetical protein n=1 Tax=Roseateles sp. TaxID=1971397 RepID=UPI003263F93C